MEELHLQELALILTLSSKIKIKTSNENDFEKMIATSSGEESSYEFPESVQQ